MNVLINNELYKYSQRSTQGFAISIVNALSKEVKEIYLAEQNLVKFNSAMEKLSVLESKKFYYKDVI